MFVINIKAWVAQNRVFQILSLQILWRRIDRSFLRCTLIADKITKPLYQLVDSMREVSGGNFQIQTDKLNGELQILSTEFKVLYKKWGLICACKARSSISLFCFSFSVSSQNMMSMRFVILLNVVDNICNFCNERIWNTLFCATHWHAPDWSCVLSDKL